MTWTSSQLAKALPLDVLTSVSNTLAVDSKQLQDGTPEAELVGAVMVATFLATIDYVLSGA